MIYMQYDGYMYKAAWSMPPMQRFQMGLHGVIPSPTSVNAYAASSANANKLPF